MARDNLPSTQSGEKPVVIAQGLTKIFKDFWLRDRARAVDNIDFQVHRGEVFGLLGPNGSGKSTTIKMILGLLKRTRGRLAVFGKPPTDVTVKKRIGYLPEESYLYPFLNARETLDYYGKLFQLDYKTRQRRIEELLDMVGLAAVQHRQVREYSKGMQRRIGIAQALINDPEFLILDEPTTGLDPIGTRQIKDLIIQLGNRGKTILLSSHLLADVEECVDRMVILYGGRIRAEGTCDDLLLTRTRTIIETEAVDEKTLSEIDELLRRHGMAIDRVSHPRQRLEELFLDIVERARAEHLATSGAQHGGQTASFLLDHEARSAEGTQLIERLTSTQRAESSPNRSTPVVSQSQREAPADTSVIDELLSRGTATRETTRQQSPAHPPAPGEEAAAPVDQSIIDSLTRKNDPKGRDRGS